MRWRNERGGGGEPVAGMLAVAVTAVLGLGLAVAPVQTASAASLAGPLPATKPTPAELVPPLVVPADGSWLEGTTTIAATPVVADDDVTSLTLDGAELDATPTVGVSHLRFDVGTNSIEQRYGNHVLVNGEHRIDLGDLVNERVDLEVPNEVLVQGENTITFVTGTINTSCGVNHDDFVVSNVGLELLGEVADGEENEYSFNLGDGNCGSNSSKLLDAELSFFVLGDPQRTTGLSTDLDTTTVANGSHTIVATTASGATATRTVTVKNAPVGAPYVTPADGTIATGVQPVFATQRVDADGGVASLSVDGADAGAAPVLGAGDAVLSFNVASNSIEARYHSYVVVNGMELDLGGDHANRRVDVVFPNEWLRPGSNTIDFVTGTFQTSCGANRDDYVVSAFALTPAAGTAVGVGLAGSYRMGDGNCGSNATLLREARLEFTVEAPAQGLRADVDTTVLADGEHEIAAASTTGEVATRLLITDNSGPAVASSVPAAGAVITQAVPLDLQLEDASGILSGPEITLDGQTVAPGDLVGPGLGAGEHTIAVTAVDGLGNGATREIVFTSAGIPDVPAELAPASGSTDVTDPALLAARVAEPDGGDVTATFSQAEILTPNQVWQGTSQGIPTTLRVEGEQVVAGAPALLPGDGITLDTDASRDVAFQRFDVMVKGHVQAPVLRWAGTIDPDRVATLRAWNLETSTWDALASSRGAAEGPTELTAEVDDRYLDQQQVHVMVTGEDPFADDLQAEAGDGFADPAEYDFSIAHFTDTQYLSEGAVEQETPEERAIWESAYAGVTEWIAANAESRRIAYVAHTGDLIENNIRTPASDAMQEQVVGEFEVSSDAHATLDDAGVPNGVIAGNHDNRSGTENGPEAIYNRYFGPDRYRAAAGAWQQAEYGGSWREGDNQNHYDLFSAGGLDFVVVGLSYGVTREEAEWADGVFKQFSDRNGILLSHDYLAPSTQPDGRNARFTAPDGAMLYDRVVADNPNVFLILAGHEHGVGTNVKPNVGEIDHGVVELLADYQFYTVSADRLGLTEIGGYAPDAQLRFGASFFRMLQIDVERSIMHVDTYSPLLDEFGATEYDDRHRYDGSEDDLVLPIDLTSRMTSFSTDAVALYVPTAVIGEATVASGEVASVEWTKLKAGTAYAWIVTARSVGGGTSTSEPSVLITRDAAGRPGTPDAGSELLPFFGQDAAGTR
ncbi:metallophosphoesterase [Agromyces sp. H66]|uniref:metallophosphoesterase n=1 Tax=Agromyces sp. H66 TaxID=2529859 RepID=UPI0010AB279E|nr:metallophosphoesterase [Agromyces sp. H66]